MRRAVIRLIVELADMSSPIFSTIVNFHQGDDATVWGVTLADFRQTILENQGAPGFRGVDILYSEAGQPDVSFVLAGYTGADINSGKLSMSYGRTQDLPGLAGSDYVTVQNAV